MLFIHSDGFLNIEDVAVEFGLTDDPKAFLDELTLLLANILLPG